MPLIRPRETAVIYFFLSVILVLSVSFLPPGSAMLATQTRSLQTVPMLSSSLDKYVPHPVCLFCFANKDNSYVMSILKVLFEHTTSGISSAPDKVQRIMVQRTGEDNCDYDHGHHESDWQRLGTSDFATVNRTEAICENLVMALELLGTLILFL